MGVPLLALLCFVYVCVCLFYFLIVFYLHCRIIWDVALLFASPPLCFEVLGVQLMWKVWSCFSWDCTWCSKTRPDHMNSKLQQVLPSLPSTKPISAQHGDGVCSVRWLPGLKHDAAAEWSPNTTCFLPSSPTIFSLLLLSFSVCLSPSPLQERNICSRPKGDALNTSSF